MDSNLKSKKGFIILIAIVIIIVVGMVLYFVNNKEKSAEASISYGSKSVIKTSSAPTKEKIKFEKVGVTKAGDFVIKVTNNNNSNVAIYNISTIFKDSDNNFIEKVDSWCSYVCIPANSFTYIYNSGYNKNMDQYENYEFSCEILDNYNEDFVYSGIEITANDTGKQISVTAKNNSGKDLDRCNVVVLFYNSDEVVGIVEGFEYESIENGSNCYLNIDYPEDSHYKKVSFDRYEVYYVGAEIGY